MSEFITHMLNPRTTRRVAPFNDLARRALLRMLDRLRDGRLTLTDGDQAMTFGAADADLAAAVHVHDPQFYSDVVFGGPTGAAESYTLGRWTTNDLTAVVRILARNRHVMEPLEGPAAWLTRLVRRAAHELRRNSPGGSRRNIRAHYDLGNDFFRLFLDESMMYSSAIYERPDATLEQAQEAKLDRICRKLELKPGDRVIEIGTGWGGFALHAAGRYGCHVTTTTISREQYELARARVHDAGLEDRIDVRFQDYRELEGRFDKLVSIEMIEAVGHHYYGEFFETCARLLKPEGMMLMQAITIEDQRFERAARNVDFIKRYIFPGSCIPSVTALCSAATRASDLRLFHLEDFGPHYARTLREWRERFFARLDRVRAMGYPESFVRMWQMYLCYCEGGFLERTIGVTHMLLTRPRCRRAPILTERLEGLDAS